MSELIDISIDSLIRYSLPILTLSSIGVSATVAILVMKENHNENLKMREEDRKAQDNLKVERSERILNDYIMISEGYAKGIKTTDDLQKISIEILLKEVANLIDDCKKIREYDYYYIEDRQIEIFEVTDTLIFISKNIEFLLITEGLTTQVTSISKKFSEIQTTLEDFYKKSNHITLK